MDGRDDESPACLGIHPRESSCIRHASGWPRPTGVPIPISCPRYHPRTSAALVVFHHLDGLSLPKFWVCCAPVPDRIRCVSDSRDLHRNAARTRVVPDSAVHTLRRFPLAGSRTASLRPLPPRRSPDVCARGGLTTPVAFMHPCSARASDPKTHPRAEWPLAARCRVAPTMDRRPSGQHTVAGGAVFPIALCSPATSTHPRVSSRTARKRNHLLATRTRHPTPFSTGTDLAAGPNDPR